MSDSPTPLVPAEGWHVIHLYYSHRPRPVVHAFRKRTAPSQNRPHRISSGNPLTSGHPSFSFLRLPRQRPTLDSCSSLPICMTPPPSRNGSLWDSDPMSSTPLTIISHKPSVRKYTTSSEQYGKDTLIGEDGLTEGSEEFEAALKEFDERMVHYLKHRMYPVLPDWPVICFYPMSKRRAPHDDYNWYSLEHDARAKLMKGHAKTGPQICWKNPPTHHRLHRPRRARMGRHPPRQGHSRNQKHRLRNALR